MGLAHRCTITGVISIIVLGGLGLLGLIGQPLGQYLAMLAVIIFIGGAGYECLEMEQYSLKTYTICMACLVLICIFYIVEVPVVTPIARGILRFLGRG